MEDNIIETVKIIREKVLQNKCKKEEVFSQHFEFFKTYPKLSFSCMAEDFDMKMLEFMLAERLKDNCDATVKETLQNKYNIPEIFRVDS